MAEGKAEREWYYAATICHVIANAHRDRERKPEPYTPNDFHPHHARESADEVTLTLEPAESIDLLFRVWGGQK